MIFCGLRDGIACAINGRASGEKRKYSAGISERPDACLKNPLYGGLAGRVVCSSHGSFATECSVLLLLHGASAPIPNLFISRPNCLAFRGGVERLPFHLGDFQLRMGDQKMPNHRLKGFGVRSCRGRIDDRNEHAGGSNLRCVASITPDHSADSGANLASMFKSAD